MKKIGFIWILLLLSQLCYADTTELVVTLEGVTNLSGEKYTQRMNYLLPWDTVCQVHLRCYRQDGKDSLKIYDVLFEDVRLHAGTASADLDFARSRGYRNEDWFEIIKKFGLIAPGDYTVDLELFSGADTIFRRRLLQHADSSLSPGSGLGRQVNAAMLLKQGKEKAGRSIRKQQKDAGDPEKQAAQSKLSRQLRSVKGLETRPVQHEGKLYSIFWYKGFMLGRSELSSVRGLSDKAKSESDNLQQNASSKVQNELEDFRSVGAQVRELYGNNKKQTKVNGFIELNTFHATGTDPNSAVEPDYSEVLLHTDIEIKGLPISVEGFYTTQDQHREAKASYFRFHYDVESVKGKLQQMINGYKSKINETMSKGKGLDQVYGSYAGSLEQQKAGLLRGLSRAYGLDESSLAASGGDISKLGTVDTAALLKGKTGEQIPAGDVAARKERLQQRRKEIMEQYQRIMELEEKINRYRSLLAQYQDQARLDSTLNYSKVKELEGKDASYKDMAKAASGLLPEGKAKTFAAGLTSFDLGIINKYESDYTMAGQTLKGLSLGYDLGLLRAVICGGSTEYANREGKVDRYSSVLLRLDSKGLKGHKVSLIYNGNTPSRSLLKDDKFTGGKSITYPSFTSPVHVLSLVYEGLMLKKNLELHTEWASSFRNGVPPVEGMERLALNNSLQYHIPGTGIALKGEWEHLGRDFENNTLPYIRSATDRYTAGTSLDLFGSFLSLNVQYNYLLQQNFSSKAYSQKWGIDLRTHSKRYPNVSFAYKPFSTFRSYADTLNIPQRPLIGEVWTGRASYQYKRNKIVHRFTLLYNSNRSHGDSDTSDYQSSTAQAAYTYTTPGLGLNVTAARIELPAGFSNGTGLMSSYIFSAGINKTLSPTVEVSLSPEVSLCDWGMQRLAGTGTVVYRFAHKPLAVRVLLRCSNYRLKPEDDRVTLYAGQLGLTWQFKYPRSNQNQ